MRFCLLAIFILVFSWAGVARAQENRFWIIWELIEPRLNCGADDPCEPLRRYTTRLLASPAGEELRNMIGLLDQLALEQGLPVEHPDAPRICQAHDPEVLIGFDPEKRELSDRLAALKDLPGVYFNLDSLNAPPGYGGNFGENLQAEFETRFRAAGIRLLTEEQMIEAPGQPQLNVYFSNANLDTGCNYSVFASLSQTMLLTRNINVKLKVGTWGMSEGPSSDFPDQTEYDAILRIADAFATTYIEANQ